MFAQIWALLKSTVSSFIEDEALTRGAAIAFYTVTTIGPLLLIVIGIAGFFFGREAAQSALIDQLSGLLGPQTTEFFNAILSNATTKEGGAFSAVIGFATLIITAAGVFGEMQSALNTVWKVETRASSLSKLLWARAASLGLVVTLGFLLMVSLAASAALTAFGDYLNRLLPFGNLVISGLNLIISFALIAFLFGAIYKVLPDRTLEWKDVITGALASAFLFSIGKFLIGWYLGATATASSYGAAGALVLMLLWVFYSVQIFVLGAEFTKAYAQVFGSRIDKPMETKVVKI